MKKSRRHLNKQRRGNIGERLTFHLPEDLQNLQNMLWRDKNQSWISNLGTQYYFQKIAHVYFQKHFLHYSTYFPQKLFTNPNWTPVQFQDSTKNINKFLSFFKYHESNKSLQEQS